MDFARGGVGGVGGIGTVDAWERGVGEGVSKELEEERSERVKRRIRSLIAIAVVCVLVRSSQLQFFNLSVFCFFSVPGSIAGIGSRKSAVGLLSRLRSIMYSSTAIRRGR